MSNLFIEKPVLVALMVNYVGTGNIHGKTMSHDESEKDKITPFCNIKLFNQKTNMIVLNTFSDENGKYSFRGIDLIQNIFFIVSHDPNRKFNGAIADHIGGENVDN